MRRLELVLLLPVLMSATPAPSVAARMHESWAHATLARDRLVAGDLPGVQAAALALSEVGPDRELPASWRPGAEALRTVAAELSKAKDLQTASVLVGRLGGACGTCHAATDGGPDLKGGADLPAQAFQPGDNMRLHAWASQWLWLGLVGPSDEAWNRGAAALDDQPLDLRWDEKPPADGRQELEQLVYVLASQATKSADATARAELYGQLTATCAQCHTKAPATPAGRSGPK